MRLVQISDLHVGRPGSVLYDRAATHEDLARAVEHVATLRPDAIVATGDLVDEGHPDEYALLRSILAPLSAPIYVLPGNHDEREGLRAAFGDSGFLPRAGFVQYAIELGPIRLVALDTNVPRAPHGELCSERLAWLDATLAAAPATPTIVAMHHPPFATGMRGIDAMGLLGSEGLAAVIERHPQVERVVCGHIHRAITRRFARTVASVCPSTTHQVALDLDTTKISIRREPPCVVLHLWREDTGLVSHTSVVGDFGAPLVVVE